MTSEVYIMRHGWHSHAKAKSVFNDSFPFRHSHAKEKKYKKSSDCLNVDFTSAFHTSLAFEMISKRQRELFSKKPFLLLYDIINKVGKDIMAQLEASSVSL